jgi:hypothetical protein
LPDGLFEIGAILAGFALVRVGIATKAECHDETEERPDGHVDEGYRDRDRESAEFHHAFVEKSE